MWFGGTEEGVPDGHNGKFEGKGTMTVIVNGNGVNSPVEMTVSLAMSEPFELTA